MWGEVLGQIAMSDTINDAGIELAKLVAETAARHVSQYDSGRIALYYDEGQSFDFSSHAFNIERVGAEQFDPAGGRGKVVRVTVSPAE